MSTGPGYTYADNQRVAGATSFDRGLDYLDSVTSLRIADTGIAANVAGTYPYQVRLEITRHGLAGACSCPFGEEGNFCKHCVATAVAALERHNRPGQDASTVVGTQPTPLSDWLESLSKEELLSELLGVLADNPDLQRSFEMRAAAENTDAAAIRRGVRELIALDVGYVEYADSWKYAHKVSEAAEAIGSLIEAGGAAEALDIAREAFTLFTHAYQSVDDSSGMIGDAGRELLDVRLRACEAAPPDPIELAIDLADLSLDSEWGHELTLNDYAGLLGDDGLACFWEEVSAAYEVSPHDYRARTLLLSRAETAGNVDELVAIHAADLDDYGHGHLRIVQALEAAGRSAEALHWAERGLREAPRADDQLADFAAARYAAEGRHSDALALRHGRFQGQRTLASYRALRQAGDAAGCWPAERALALDQLGKDARIAQPVLVDALLDDGDLDAAWTAITAGVAKVTAGQQQRIRVADALISTRPADALAIYRQAMDKIWDQTGDPVYEQMIRLLLSSRKCYEALGTPAEFTRLVAYVRTHLKRKRNLMKLMDRHNLCS